MEFPTLKSNRLLLKRLTQDYIKEVYDHFHNEEVNKYVDFEPVQTLEDAKEIIDWGLNLYQNNNGILWGIFKRDKDIFIGQINYVLRADLNFTGKIHRAEIGFDLSPAFWGNGYMSEATKLGNEYIFNEMKINRIEAIVHLLNTRAHRTLEKIGFEKEGILREYVQFKGVFWDMLCYSLLKKEWRLNAEHFT
jgi:ribosomal-protein-alanine N-acetyltransferase